MLECMHAQVSIEIIEYEDLSFGKFLGQGAEGEVYAAWYMDTPVAVKQTSSIAEVEMNLHAGAPRLTLCCICTPGLRASMAELA